MKGGRSELGGPPAGSPGVLGTLLGKSSHPQKEGLRSGFHVGIWSFQLDQDWG